MLKKEFIKPISILIFRLLLAIICVALIYPKDKLTCILLFFILLMQPVISLLGLKRIHKVDKNFNFLSLNSNFKKISYILYIVFLAIFVISLVIFKANTLAITISIIALLYAYNFNEKSVIAYNKDIAIYGKTTIDLKKISIININNNSLTISYFNGTKQEIKVSSNDEAKILEKILKKRI